MDPITRKISPSLSDTPNSDTRSQATKTGASRFGQLKSQMANSADVSPKAAEGQPVGGDRSVVKRDAREGTSTHSSRVENGLAVGQHHLNRLKERINSIPDVSSSRDVESLLRNVEQQYTKLDSIASTLPPNASPQQWMGLQQQVYRMNENINALSKLVSQTASGVKTIVQTQV